MYILKIAFSSLGVPEKTITFTDKINVVTGLTSQGKSYFFDISDTASISLNGERISVEEYIIFNHEVEANYYNRKERYKDVLYDFNSRIKDNKLKLILIDDFNVKEDIERILQLACDRDLIVIIHTRKYQLKNFRYKRYLIYDPQHAEIINFLEFNDIYKINQNKKIENCSVLRTEDKQTDKSKSGYKYWEYNTEFINNYYNLNILNIIGLNGIENVYKKIKADIDDNYLLCLDYAWDNLEVLNALQKIIDIIQENNLNNVILSLYSYEQLVILSNLTVIKQCNVNLAEDLEECITQFKSPKILCAKYFRLNKKEASFYTTQEHFYKSLLPKINKMLIEANLELNYNALDLKYLYNPRISSSSYNRHTNHFNGL
jgi:hypothetical protein